MQLFKHAYFSLKYNKLQWLIKCLFLFLYLNLTFSLIDSINGFRKEIKESQAAYAAQVQLFPASEETAGLTYQQLEDYSKSKYVDTIEHTGFLYLALKEEQPLDHSQEKISSSAVPMIGILPQSELTSKVKAIDGNELSELNAGECLISQQYAESEQIGVGDTLSYVNNQEPVNFTVRGIYQSDEARSFTSEIYTTVEAIEAQNKQLYEQIDWYSVFHLKDQTMVEDFSSELKEKGLSDHYQIFSNEEYAKEETVFLNEAIRRAVYGLFSVILLGIVPLYGLAMLFKKKQLTEIGFLYSMGISRSWLTVMYVGNNLLLLLLTGLLTVFSIGHYISSFAQFVLNTTQKTLDAQTTGFFSTNSFSIVASVVEPITAISVDSSFSVEKVWLVAVVLLVLSMSTIMNIRRFQLGDRLMEELE